MLRGAEILKDIDGVCLSKIVKLVCVAIAMYLLLLCVQAHRYAPHDAIAQLVIKSTGTANEARTQALPPRRPFNNPVQRTHESVRFVWQIVVILPSSRFTVRLVYVWQIRESPFFDVLMGDARRYDAWAMQIASGDWIGQEVFYQAPLYPYFLGPSTRLRVTAS